MPKGIRGMKILKAAKIAPLMLHDKGFENWCDVICDVTSRGSSGDGLLVYLLSPPLLSDVISRS